jgi:hypothetical protein
MLSLAHIEGKVETVRPIPATREKNTRTGYFERDLDEEVANHLPDDLKGIA